MGRLERTFQVAAVLCAALSFVGAGCGKQPASSPVVPQAAPKPVATDSVARLARAAWAAATRVSSPIDAGRETIGVAGRLADGGRIDLLQEITQKRQEAWIRGSVLAHEAYAYAQAGDLSRARTLLDQAEQEAKATTEWRRPLMEQPMSRAGAVLILESNTTASASGAATDALTTWTTAEPGRRLGAAAWACAWKARRVADAHLASAMVAAAMRFAAGLPVWERLEIMAFLAPVNTNDETRAAALAAVKALTNETTNAVGRTAAFDVVVHKAQVLHGCGDNPRAMDLLADAGARAEAGKEEDLPGAWTLLAEALKATGEPARAKAAFFRSLSASGAQPGFNREIAYARTLAAMAASGLAWTDAEAEKALKAAK